MSLATHSRRLPSLKPRNPLAMAGRLRRAGSHRQHERSHRQQQRQALRRELHAQHPPQP